MGTVELSPSRMARGTGNVKPEDSQSREEKVAVFKHVQDGPVGESF